MRTNFVVAGLLMAVVSGASVGTARADDLGKTMGQMGRALKALGKDTADLTNNTAALTDVSNLEKASLAAKDMTPPLVAKMTGDEKAKALAEFRKQIGTLLKAELDLESAIIDKNAEDVKKDIATIMDIMKTGHKEFRKKK